MVATAFQGEVYDFSDLDEPRHKFGDAAGGPMGAIALAGDGRTVGLATQGRPPIVELYDLARGLIKLRVLEGHTQGIEDLAFSPDGALLATGSDDGSLRVWDVASGKEVFREMAGGGRGVPSVAFSADGNWIASGGGDGQVRVWTPGGEPVKTLPVGEFEVPDVAFSPDGRVLATVFVLGDAITLWDTGTWEQSLALRGHELVAGQGVFVIAFSADGKLLASGGADHTVRVWDTDATSPGYGKELVKLVGHSDWPDGMFFTPDDASLVSSSSRDGTIRVWQVAE